MLGLYDHLGEYESIDELNHLAHVLSDLDQSNIEKFEAVIDSGEYTGSVHDLINLVQNLDCYDFYPGIDSEEALGRVYIEEMEMLDVPDDVLPYSPTWIDGKKHARNVYAHTREECEEKLKVLIAEMKAELAELKRQKTDKH